MWWGQSDTLEENCHGKAKRLRDEKSGEDEQVGGWSEKTMDMRWGANQKGSECGERKHVKGGSWQ